jgi:two-component system, OmpR family, sensor histidine kinase BaeS
MKKPRHPLNHHTPFNHNMPRHPWRRKMRPQGWQDHNPRIVFFRFAALFGMITLLLIGGLAILAFLILRFSHADRGAGALMMGGGCLLAMILPVLAAIISRGAFRSIATPLAEVMDAAENVAQGNLDIQVPEHHGEFGQLSRAFNHMVSELQRAEIQRRNLTADVAHELRTPLHILQGHLEGIIDGVYQPTPEQINTMLEETRLLSRLVEDLRTLSLAEAGQLPLTCERINLSELLADIQTSFSGQAEAAQLSFYITAAPELTVFADPDRLNQIISNLAANAIRFTPPGGTISLETDLHAEGVRIIIQDTGVGIPKEDLPFIFDRFWRGDRSRTSRDGSGLGLAICRQLVKSHGGTIHAASTPGEGTRFTLTLPEANTSDSPE